MAKLRCIFCSKLTTVREINVEKKYKGRIIAIKNVPVYECKNCNEVFYPKALARIIRFAIENLSQNKPIILYEDALYEYQKRFTELDISDEIKPLQNNNNNNSKYSILQDIFLGRYYEDCIKCQGKKLTYENIEKHSIVLMYHYTTLKPIRGIVLEKNNHLCILSFINKIIFSRFTIGDPIVIGFYHNNNNYNISGEIENIDEKNQIIAFSTNKLYTHREERKSDRIPVSLPLEIATLNSSNKKEGIVKDISLYGILICTKSQFESGNSVEVYIHTYFKIITLIGAIVTEKICTHNNEYGIEIVKVDTDDLYFFKRHFMNIADNVKGSKCGNIGAVDDNTKTENFKQYSFPKNVENIDIDFDFDKILEELVKLRSNLKNKGNLTNDESIILDSVKEAINSTNEEDKNKVILELRKVGKSLLPYVTNLNLSYLAGLVPKL